jgi:hypothetical protein
MALQLVREYESIYKPVLATSYFNSDFFLVLNPSRLLDILTLLKFDLQLVEFYICDAFPGGESKPPACLYQRFEIPRVVCVRIPDRLVFI